MSDQEEATTEEERWEDEGGSPPAKGSVDTIKQTLEEKEVSSREATPEGLEFLGWVLDGWLVQYPLLDDNARPVYAFPRD